MVKQITRDEAEKIFLKAKIIDSVIEQDSNEVRISFSLADKREFLLKYSLSDHVKHYYLCDV